jgi:hypothetical protein
MELYESILRQLKDQEPPLDGETSIYTEEFQLAALKAAARKLEQSIKERKKPKKFEEILFPPLEYNPQSKSQNYDVQIRQKKKWINLNKTPLDRASALNYGRNVLDNSSEASLRLHKSNKKGKPSTYASTGNEYKFRVKGNVLIERRKFRIDTIGEKNKITALGLAKLSTNRRSLF